jgi:hypothetical protein
VDPNGWTMLPPLYCRAHVNGPINDPATPNQARRAAIPLAAPCMRCAVLKATPPPRCRAWACPFLFFI